MGEPRPFTANWHSGRLLFFIQAECGNAIRGWQANPATIADCFSLTVVLREAVQALVRGLGALAPGRRSREGYLLFPAPLMAKAWYDHPEDHPATVCHTAEDAVRTLRYDPPDRPHAILELGLVKPPFATTGEPVVAGSGLLWRVAQLTKRRMLRPNGLSPH